MLRQAGISAAKLQKKVGKTLEVLIDEVGPDGAFARSQADAPEIDGNVFIEGPGATDLKPGQRVMVRITEADDYDLFAELPVAN